LTCSNEAGSSLLRNRPGSPKEWVSGTIAVSPGFDTFELGIPHGYGFALSSGQIHKEIIHDDR